MGFISFSLVPFFLCLNFVYVWINYDSASPIFVHFGRLFEKFNYLIDYREQIWKEINIENINLMPFSSKNMCFIGLYMQMLFAIPI